MEGALHKLIVQIGEAAFAVFRDSVRLVTFIGETIAEFASALCKPRRIRRKETLYYMNLCGANAVASGRQNFFADTKMDGAHYTVLMWGGTGAEDQPTVGFYVPWEVYAQAGYPEVSSLDDLVKALAAMHELHGENAEGQKVYGTGA